METTLVEKENSRLIGLYMSGDEGAIDRLFRKYQPKVYAYLLKATKNPALAGDLLQESFFKVLRSLRAGGYVDNGRFEPWLMRIVRNVVMDQHRSRSRANVLFAEGEYIPAPSHSGADPESMLIQAQRKSDVRTLLQQLPEAQRQVVILRHFIGLSFQEIADHTDVSINTALGRMRYALLNMRKMASKSGMQPV